jgi:hypothetical protein
MDNIALEENSPVGSRGELASSDSSESAGRCAAGMPPLARFVDHI